RHTRFKCDWSSDVCSSDLHNTTFKSKLSIQKLFIIHLALSRSPFTQTVTLAYYTVCEAKKNVNLKKKKKITTHIQIQQEVQTIRHKQATKKQKNKKTRKNKNNIKKKKKQQHTQPTTEP